MKSRIRSFLNPKSIAVIGATDVPGKVGCVLMEKLKNFSGEVIPVNINKKEVFGARAYKSVLHIKKRVDLAVIAIPNFSVGTVLEECGKRRIKNVIVISAGFAEVGNYKMQEELEDIANKHKINLLGPNCFGIANPYLNLDATFSNTSPSKGDIAFISQSGALWSYLVDLKRNNFSGYASLGNMAGLDFSDFIEYFNSDKRTKKIVLYIEKLKQGRKFIDACKKSGKEIIAVKAGMTKKGSKMAVSHTASLATDYAVYKGVFKQANVRLVHSLSEAIGLKQEKLEKSITPGSRVSIITNAGGAGTLITDYLESRGINVVSLKDLLGTAKAKDYFLELKNKRYKKSDKIIVVLTPQKMSEPNEVAKVIIGSKFKEKIIACFLGYRSVKDSVSLMRKNKILSFTRCC